MLPPIPHSLAPVTAQQDVPKPRPDIPPVTPPSESAKESAIELDRRHPQEAEMLLYEEQRRRHSSLRWGIVLLSVALGFGLIQWFGWRDVTPGMIAVLAGATGLGNLVFFAISRKLG